MASFFCFSCVESGSAGFIESCGKFSRVAHPGLNVINPFCCEEIAGTLSLRVQQLDVSVETITADKVSVTIVVSVQYQVNPDRLQVVPDSLQDAFYKLTDPRTQMKAYVFDVVRATVPKITLDALFEAKQEIAGDVKSELLKAMSSFGFMILQALVTDIDPAPLVKAGQAVVAEALIPLTLAKPHSSVMLCGDPRQLSPVVRCPTAALHGLSASLLELLIGYHTARAGQLRAAAAAAYEAAGAAAAAGGAEAPEGAATPTAGGATEAASMPGTAAPTSIPQQPQEAVGQRRTPPLLLINTEYSMLVRNYRSHSRLLELPSRLFYGGELVASADPAAVAAPAWHHLTATHGNGAADGVGVTNGGSEGERQADGAVLPFNTLFFGVRGQQLREGDAPSYFNPIEAVTLVDLVQSLLDQPAADGRRPVTVDDVGVIGTYRKQVQKIRLLLRERGLGAVRVGTVDDYQGQEERVIFISTVLSKPESLPAALSAKALSAAAGGQRPWLSEGGGDEGGVRPELHLGFWNNPKRFNVAITRAKALLVVVGSPMVLMKDTNWRELLRHAAARGAYRGAGLALMQTLMRSGDDGAGMDPFDAAQSAADAEGQTGSANEDAGAAAELAAAVKQIAELAQLGMGDVDRLYPETLDEFYESCADEMQWRVAL